jgi:2-iminobutanoate/2-iminopropanoate deaminase
MMLYMSESSASPSVSVPVAPATIPAPSAKYAHAMLTTAATRWLHTAGVVPIAVDGTTPEDIGEQAAVVWANIGAMLAEVQMSPANIVSLTTYVVAGQPLAAVMAARDAFLNGHIAASTLVTVPALAKPEWQMEIAIIAAA